MKYTFSDEEEGGSDAPSTRRSNRYSGTSTPAETAGPVFTASGRQVKSRHGAAYGETTLDSHQDNQGPPIAKAYGGQGEADGVGVATRGRTRGTSRNGVGRSAKSQSHTNGLDALDTMDDDSDALSSGEEWDGGIDDDDDEVDEHPGDEESHESTDLSDDSNSDGLEEIDTGRQGSLIVSLRYKKENPEPPPAQAEVSQISSTAPDQTPSLPLTNGHHLDSDLTESTQEDLSGGHYSPSLIENLSQAKDGGFAYPSKQTNRTDLSTDVTMT